MATTAMTTAPRTSRKIHIGAPSPSHDDGRKILPGQTRAARVLGHGRAICGPPRPCLAPPTPAMGGCPDDGEPLYGRPKVRGQRVLSSATPAVLGDFTHH